MARDITRFTLEPTTRVVVLVVVAAVAGVLSLVALSRARTPTIGVSDATTTSGVAVAGQAERPPAAPDSARAGSGVTAGPSAAEGQAVLPQTALIIGDGFTVSGAASGTVDQSFACQAVRARGWGCINESSVGSGYVARASSESFEQALTQAVTPTRVGLVVITGGITTGASSSAATQAAVRSTIRTARSTFPAATVIVLGPLTTQQRPRPLGRVEQTLAAAAQGARASYVDTVDWFDDVDPVTDDGGRTLTGAAVAVAASSLYAALPGGSTTGQ